MSTYVGADSLVVSASTYSATAHSDPSSIPASRSFADPAPLSPTQYFPVISPLSSQNKKGKK